MNEPLTNSTSSVRLRTGAELVRATKPFAQDNTALSWWYVLSTGTLMVIAIAATVFASFSGHLWTALGCSLLYALLMLRFFVIYHDQQHHAILAKSKVAEWLMVGFGIFGITPSSVWRASHNYHHKHNSNLRSAHIGSYPVMTKEQFEKSSKGKRLLYLFVRHPLTILFGYLFMFLFGMCLNPFLNSPKKHFDCLLSLVAHFAIAVGLVVYGGWMALLLVQTLPFLICCAIGSYLFYAQHNFPGVSFTDSAGWAYEKAALESSSYMKTSRITAWFMANIGYHHIHHLNHKIPFYRLPETMAAMPELQNARTTSLSPSEVFRCLSLKVWDTEKQKMVGLGEG